MIKAGRELTEDDRRLNVESRILGIISGHGGETIVAGAAMQRMVGELVAEFDALVREGFGPEVDRV